MRVTDLAQRDEILLPWERVLDDSMLSVENLDLHYGAAQALRGVSVAAEAGKVTCVLGRNGVGKTSLLRAIVGQQPASGGTHRLRRRAADRLALFARPRRHRLRAAGARDLSAPDACARTSRPATRR